LCSRLCSIALVLRETCCNVRRALNSHLPDCSAWHVLLTIASQRHHHRPSDDDDNEATREWYASRTFATSLLTLRIRRICLGEGAQRESGLGAAGISERVCLACAHLACTRDRRKSGYPFKANFKYRSHYVCVCVCVRVRSRRCASAASTATTNCANCSAREGSARYETLACACARARARVCWWW
jgi:hypothetical protein